MLAIIHYGSYFKILTGTDWDMWHNPKRASPTFAALHMIAWKWVCAEMKATLAGTAHQDQGHRDMRRGGVHLDGGRRQPQSLSSLRGWSPSTSGPRHTARQRSRPPRLPRLAGVVPGAGWPWWPRRSTGPQCVSWSLTLMPWGRWGRTILTSGSVSASSWRTGCLVEVTAKWRQFLMRLYENGLWSDRIL